MLWSTKSFLWGRDCSSSILRSFSVRNTFTSGDPYLPFSSDYYLQYASCFICSSSLLLYCSFLLKIDSLQFKRRSLLRWNVVITPCDREILCQFRILITLITSTWLPRWSTVICFIIMGSGRKDLGMFLNHTSEWIESVAIFVRMRIAISPNYC